MILKCTVTKKRKFKMRKFKLYHLAKGFRTWTVLPFIFMCYTTYIASSVRNKTVNIKPD